MSLDPELDLSFLGNSAEFVNYEEKKKTMERVMKHKIQATKKQAIRKLKKEAKVIDEERQKVIENIVINVLMQILKISHITQ